MSDAARTGDDPFGRRGFRWALLTALAVGALLPLVLLALVSAGRDWLFPTLVPSGVGIDSWLRLAGERDRLARATLSSLALAVACGAVATAVGVPLGRTLARLTGWRRYAGAGAAFLPVAVPPIALAVGLQVSFLHLGLGGSFAGVLLAHAVPAAGYASLFFIGIFTGFDVRLEEDARSLGATPRQVWRRVTLPLLRRPIAESFLLAFLVSWAQVPLTLVVGQGRVETLPVEVLTYLGAGQDALGAAGALLLLLPPLFGIGVVALAVRRAGVVP